jgi:hypothetical protein
MGVMNEPVLEPKVRSYRRLILELRKDDLAKPQGNRDGRLGDNVAPQGYLQYLPRQDPWRVVAFFYISNGSGLARKIVRRVEIFRWVLLMACLAAASVSCTELAHTPFSIRCEQGPRHGTRAAETGRGYAQGHLLKTRRSSEMVFLFFLRRTFLG